METDWEKGKEETSYCYRVDNSLEVGAVPSVLCVPRVLRPGPQQALRKYFWRKQAFGCSVTMCSAALSE